MFSSAYHFKIQVGLIQKTFGGFIQKQSILPIFYTLLATLLINACSSDVSAPKLNRPSGITYEACNNSDLDLRHLTESAVRNFIDCINGPQKNVQAYKDFIDELSSKELEVLLRVYNTHMVDEARFKKALSLYNKMLLGGEFDQMMQAFAAMNDFGILESLIPLFKNLYSTNGGLNDPAVDALNEFIVKLIDRDQFTDSTFTIAKFMDNGRSRLITKLITAGSYLTDYNSDRVVDDLSNAFYYGVQTGGFKELSILLYDPLNFKMFQETKLQSPGATAGINSYLEYLSLNSQVSNQLSDLVKLTRVTNRSAVCFSASDKEQHIDNLFMLGFEEVERRDLRNQEEIAEFYLEEVPFHLQNLKYQCNLPVEMTAFYPSFSKALLDGYGEQLIGLQYGFHKYSRLTYLIDLMSSNQLSSIFASVANTADRDVLAYFLDMLTENLEQKDFYSISQLVNYLMIEDLEEAATNKWIKNAPFMEEDLRQELLVIQESANLGLIELLQYMDTSTMKSSKYYSTSARFRTYLGRYDFVDAPSNYVLPVLQKLVSPNGNSRQNIKDLVSKLLKLWTSDEPGLSDFMVAMANSMEYSVDRPIQAFVRDLLSDKEFVTAINPLLLKLVDKKSFLDAVSLTADLGRNGELSRLLAFFHSMSVALPLEPLDPEPLASSFEEFQGKPEDFLKDYRFSVVPLSKDYRACDAILKYNSNWDSSYIRYLALCFGQESNVDLMEIMSLLEKLRLENGRGALDTIGAFISQDILRSAYFYPLLDSIENLYTSGELNQVFDFIQTIKNNDSGLLENMEKVLAVSCENENTIKNPHWLTRFVQEEGSEKIPALLPEILLLNRVSQFPGVEFSPLTISDEDLATAKSEWDRWKFNLSDQSWKEDEELYWLKLQNDFKYQTDSYFYDLGIFERPSSVPGGENAFYTEFLRQGLYYVQRGESLWAMISAIKNLEEENYPWIEFFEFASMRSQLIPYYPGKDKKPMVRFATTLERAEILVQNSRLGVASWVPGLGVEDIGSFFQIELARSNNYKNTLHKLKSQIDLGLAYTKALGRNEKHNKLRNIDVNFEVLEAMAENGLLKFFGEIYRHLVEATPVSEQVQNPDRVYSSIVHEPMKLGVFSYLSKTYQQWKQVGLAEDFVSSFVTWVSKITYEEAKDLQEMLVILWELEEKHEIISPLYEIVASNPIELSDSESLDIAKALLAMPANLGFMKPILLEWKKDPSRLVEQFDFLWNQVLRSKEELLRMARVASYWQEEDRENFAKLFNSLSQDKAWVLSAWKEVDLLLQNNRDLLDSCVTSYFAWKQEVPVNKEHVFAMAKLLEQSTLHGREIFKAFLENADTREATIAMTCELAKTRKLGTSLDLINDFRNSKGFENVFKMLRKYFTK